MFRTIVAIFALCLPAVVRADGGITVPLPDLGGFSEAQNRELLTALVTANVVSSNCAGYAITDGEWTLLTGSADIVAANLGLDTDAYDAEYYDPAFALLDRADTCAVEGPKVRGVIDLMVDLGGATTRE